jgi:hypothetical protein
LRAAGDVLHPSHYRRAGHTGCRCRQAGGTHCRPSNSACAKVAGSARTTASDDASQQGRHPIDQHQQGEAENQHHAKFLKVERALVHLGVEGRQ